MSTTGTATKATIMGHPQTHIYRWCGSQGWRLWEVRKVATHFGITASMATISLCLNSWSQPQNAKPINLTQHEIDTLHAIRDGKPLPVPPAPAPVTQTPTLGHQGFPTLTSPCHKLKGMARALWLDLATSAERTQYGIERHHLKEYLRKLSAQLGTEIDTVN